MKAIKANLGALALVLELGGIFSRGMGDEARLLLLFVAFVLTSLLTGYWIRCEKKLTSRVPLIAVSTLVFTWALLVYMCVRPLFG